MSDQELQEFLRAAEAFTQEVIEEGRALEVLVEEGIYTCDGELTAEYK